MSSDEGQTWSPPVKVNQTPLLGNLNDQAFTALGPRSARRHGGRELLRLPQQHRGRRDRHRLLPGALPTPRAAARASWVGPRTKNRASFNSRLAPVARGFFLGDYVGLDDTGTAFSVLYTEGVSAANPTDEFYATGLAAGGPPHSIRPAGRA